MGTRLRADVSDNLSLLGAVFDGNAAGPGPDDPQLRDRYGLNFRVNDPPLVLGEVQFLWNAKKGDPGLAGKFKIGGWRHFGDFSDQRIEYHRAVACRSQLRRHAGHRQGDFGVYSVFEQKLYRVGDDDDRGIGIFARASYSPPDRNLIDLYADAGIEFVGLSDQPAEGQVRHRAGLRAGIAVGSRARCRFSALERTAVAGAELRGSCHGASISTKSAAAGRLQPNFQYIVHPGGGATNPLASYLPGKPLKDAAVFGLRTVVKF